MARLQQDVFRLDVAVHHTLAVGVAQGIGHLTAQVQHLVQRQLLLASQAFTKGLALDVGHDVIQASRRLARVVQREDVRMVEPGGGLDLEEEAVDPEARGELGAQDLHSYWASVLQVPGEEDQGHAAPAQLPLEPVAVS